MVKVSIVIPVHNDVVFTKQCIDSIRRSTNSSECELIIVDNGSDQATKEFLSTLKATIITNDKNEGFAKAINKGISKCRAEYILLLNNDTALFPGWLAKMIAAFDNTTGAVGPLSNYVMGKQRVVVGRKEATPEQIHNIVSVQNKGHVTETDLLIGFALMISKRTISTVGLLDERFFAGSEDLDYSLRIRRSGLKLKIVEDVFIFHAGSRTSKNILQKSDEFYKQANEEFFKKWTQELGIPITSHRQAFEIGLNQPGPKLTMNIIVKNEFGLLENMIKKTNAFCDDYVVVDTGSTDGSIDKLNQLLLNNGCMLNYKWDNNFSHARNFGLDKCRGKWIMQLDADELIDPRHVVLMKRMLDNDEVDAFRFKIINFRECPFLVNEPKQDVLTSIRMWRNNKQVRYSGMIHETVTDSISTVGLRVADSPVPILHFAYLKPSGRHMALMEQATRLEPKRGNSHYFLGEEYIRRGEMSKAINCFINALACNMVKNNEQTFARPVQQMIDITKATLEGKDVESFPDNIKNHFKYLIGR